MRAHLISLRTLFAGLLIAMAVCLGASAAQAQTGGDYTTRPPTSAGTTTTIPAQPAIPVKTVKTLPVTGSNIGGLAVVGVILLASGAVVLAVRRQATKN